MHDVTRHIKKEVERELWARAGGRCQFKGHNQLLYKSAITQEAVNLAEKAHIYSFSENGPRGWGPFALNRQGLNDIRNLLLVCNGCHTVIDQDKKGDRYSATLLLKWKREHENRIEVVTGIDPHNRSHVVLYGANIGNDNSPLNYDQCVTAMFPLQYPAEERPQILSMSSVLRDSTREYWQAEEANLHRIFSQKIVPLIESDTCKHFSVFALAPQPLLIFLGTLFTDKYQVDTYQLHREPESGWNWQERPNDFNYDIIRPDSFQNSPVLILSLSDHINLDRIKSVLGENVSVWMVTIQSPHNDFLKSKSQLSAFREIVRQLMVDIKEKHGNTTPLSIFPAMPVSCCIELGRVRMPKAEMPWIIFDQNNTNGFIKTLEIK